MLNPINKTIELSDGRVITIETGKLAKQADGAVTVRMNNTMLLATVCAAKDANPGVDFMPLQVEYKEKFSAFGRFPGGFTKREGKASDYEISQLLAEIMGAPAFEEVAGMTNKYSNELILDYGAYMIFLIDVADNQTDLV